MFASLWNSKKSTKLMHPFVQPLLVPLTLTLWPVYLQTIRSGDTLVTSQNNVAVGTVLRCSIEILCLLDGEQVGED
jgi:hypothetical protein